MAWKEQKFLLNNIMKIKNILTLILIIIPINVYGNFLKLNTPAKQVILYDHELKKVLFELRLLKKCQFSRVTGSGSACFGVFLTKKSANLGLKKIRKKFHRFWCVVGKTI